MEKNEENTIFKGVSDEEIKLIQAVLVFLRTCKRYDSMEIKMDLESPHKFSVLVKQQYKQLFDL